MIDVTALAEAYADREVRLAPVRVREGLRRRLIAAFEAGYAAHRERHP